MEDKIQAKKFSSFSLSKYFLIQTIFEISIMVTLQIACILAIDVITDANISYTDFLHGLSLVLTVNNDLHNNYTYKTPSSWLALLICKTL